MTASTKTAPSISGISTTIEETAGRIKDLNEKLVAAAKQSGTVSIDAYDKALISAVALEKKIAGATKLGFISTIADAHTNFITEISGAYTAAARDALK